jgi:hypothetical protein
MRVSTARYEHVAQLAEDDAQPLLVTAQRRERHRGARRSARLWAISDNVQLKAVKGVALLTLSLRKRRHDVRRESSNGIEVQNTLQEPA